MAGITPFDVIGELKSLQEKGIIDAGVRKKWESKVVAEGVTEEIIDQIAGFKMREMEINREDQIKLPGKNEAAESLPGDPKIQHSFIPESMTMHEPTLFSLNPTVSDVVSEFRRLTDQGILDSKIGKMWESRAINEGITEDIVAQINSFRAREVKISRGPESAAKYGTDEREQRGSAQVKKDDGGRASTISIIALVLAAAGLFVPYFVALFLVPVALALGCVAVYKKEKFGKLAVVLAVIGVGWIFFVSTQISAIFKDPFAPNILTSSSKSQVVTMAKYNRIREGMTYREVTSIIGSSGEEQSSSSIAGNTFSTYVWQNENGSNAMIVFENGKVSTKAQFGLR